MSKDIVFYGRFHPTPRTCIRTKLVFRNHGSGRKVEFLSLGQRRKIFSLGKRCLLKMFCRTVDVTTFILVKINSLSLSFSL